MYVIEELTFSVLIRLKMVRGMYPSEKHEGILFYTSFEQLLNLLKPFIDEGETYFNHFLGFHLSCIYNFYELI